MRDAPISNWSLMQWAGKDMQDEPWNHLRAMYKGLYHQHCQRAQWLSLWHHREEGHEQEATRRYSGPIAEHPWLTLDVVRCSG